ncbi:MAG TPA: hypothetical protein VK769_01525 [Verrucomicrobiae bacterium]|nr:hypothetical protein [Verrucomicrobiae bacterium]
MSIFKNAIIAFIGLSLVSKSFAGAVLDQQQLIYNGGLSALTSPSNTVWQSFTAGISGTLTEIDMGFFNNLSGSGQLQIFAGVGTGGTLLQTLTVPVVGIAQPAVTWNDWSVNVSVQAGQHYTFNFTPNAATLPNPYGVAIGPTNSYAGGVMGLNDPSGSYTNQFDLVFRTFVTPNSVEPNLSIQLFSEVELCWPSQTNLMYQVQYSSTLATNQWSPLNTNWIIGTGTEFCTNDIILAGQPQRFYRVAVMTNSP